MANIRLEKIVYDDLVRLSGKIQTIKCHKVSMSETIQELLDFYQVHEYEFIKSLEKEMTDKRLQYDRAQEYMKKAGLPTTRDFVKNGN